MRVCRYHGGKSTGNRFKHGRYSRALGPLGKTYSELLSRRDLREVDPGLALMDLRAERLLERAVTGHDSPSWRQDVLKAFEAYREAFRAQDPGLVKETMAELGRLIFEGVDTDKAMGTAVDLVERRNAATIAAERLDLERERNVSERELLAALGLVLDVVRRELPADTANRVAAEIDRELRARSRPVRAT